MQIQWQCWATIHKSFTWGTWKCDFSFTEPIWIISQQTQLNSTHIASCFLSLHRTSKLSEILKKIIITIYSYKQLNNNAGTGTKMWRKTWKIMNSTLESINEGKRGNPTAWNEVDNRAKDITNNNLWIFNTHTQGRPDDMSPFSR